MKRLETRRAGEILEEALKANALDVRLLETRASQVWPKVVGEHIAGQCRDVWTRDGVMSMKIASAPLRQELSMHRTSLIEALHKAIGAENVVHDIRFY